MKQVEQQLLRHTDKINTLLARYGVKFGIYKNNTFKEQLFPFDSTDAEAKTFGLKYVVERSVRPYDTATLNYN